MVPDDRWVVYVDMDAYYVSCERRRRPELVGRPVIVGFPPGPRPARSVVLSASYEARALGVRSAQPVEEAAHRAPDAVWIPPDFELYEATAESVRERLRKFDPSPAIRSIDEAALAVTADAPEAVRSRAREIQQRLARELQLPCSIGASPFEVVAKIASDRAKPGGIVVVPREGTREFLAPLPVRSVPGIGPKTEALLLDHGWSTLGGIARARRTELRSVLGPGAGGLLDLARGSPRPSTDRPGRGGFRSADHTFDEDRIRWEEIAPAITDLALALGRSLASQRLRFSAVSVAFRWSDFSRSQRRRSLPGSDDAPSTIQQYALRLARELWEDRRTHPGVRTVSVRAEALVPSRGVQRSLDRFFDLPPRPPPVM
ncbi:MAG: Y-family DNA polymerase [Thermoplasmata archaeon]